MFNYLNSTLAKKDFQPTQDNNFGENASLSENDTEEINNEVQQPNGEGEHVNSILVFYFSSF